MASTRLQNYLCANRNRLGMSQDDVAFLLGVQSRAKVSRNERFVHVPNLETAFAYEIILQRPARELFHGLYEQLEHDIAARAKILNARVSPSASPLVKRRRAAIAGLSTRTPAKSFQSP